MKKEIDCQVFEDQLDALMGGTLTEEGLGPLQAHALSCAECATLLRVQEHLLPTLGELESRIPDDLLTTLWPRIEAEVGISSPAVTAAPPPDTAARTLPATGHRHSLPWLVPALAAASLVLLLSTGFLFSELVQTRGRAQQLALQVAAVDRWMSEVGGEGGLVQRTADLAGKGRTRTRAFSYALSGQDQVRISTLIELLRTLPEGEVVLTASQLAGLRRITSRPSPEMREVLAFLDGVLPRPGGAEDVRAGELIEWLASARLPADLVLPKSPLIELFS